MIEASVDERFGRFLQLESPTYSQFMTTLTRTQLVCLKFHADHGARSLKWQSVARTLGLAASTLRRATEGLVAKAFLRRVFDGEMDTKYAFEDPFLGEWARRRLHV